MRECDEVIVPDGRIGHIIELFDNGDCLVEFKTPNGPHRYDDELFKAGEVAKVVRRKKRGSDQAR